MKYETIYIGSEIYRSAAFGHNHPLSYARQESVLDMCRGLNWLPGVLFVQSPTPDFDTLTRYHDQDYVRALRSADKKGKATIKQREQYNFGTMENPLFKGVFKRAATTIGGSIEAAKLAIKGHTVFHPSGGTHHGLKDRAHGFCYFNDPVFSILTFLDAGFHRVLYVDIDAHHGDGVEAAFVDDPRVHCISIHEEDRWPYSGKLTDQSDGQINIPVPQNINDSEFNLLFGKLVLPYCKKLKPEAIVITCGADGLRDDPLSKMCLSNGALWDAVLALRAQSPACVVLGGGGYNPWTTVRCWVGLWGRLAGFEFPKTLPPSARAILEKFDSDLIDEEDRNSEWMTSLEDPQNLGPIRNNVKELVQKLKGGSE